MRKHWQSIVIVFLCFCLLWLYTGRDNDHDEEILRSQRDSLLNRLKMRQNHIVDLNKMVDSLGALKGKEIIKRQIIYKNVENNNNRIDLLPSDTAYLYVSRHDSVWQEIYLYAKER